jgi:Ca2+-binding EF-hand superfamily protein
MKEVFALYADSKGRAVASQLLQVLHTLNINCTKDECQTFFKELDSDSDGYIDFTCFIRGLKWIKTVRNDLRPIHIARFPTFNFLGGGFALT